MTPEFKKKAIDKLHKFFAVADKYDDLFFSALFIGIGIAGTISTGSAIPLLLFGCFGLQHLTMREKKKEIRHGHGTQDILIDYLGKLASEYAKDCGPKKPNDILRNLIEELDKHHNRDKKPPKSRGKKRFKMPFFKTATGGAGA